jgi:UDP-N-acetylglucosamine acyltransferase
MPTSIDPRAAVSPKAVLGENISVGPFTVVEAGAVIGDGTTVASNALISGGARIGKECRIHHGAVIGHVPQDLKYAGEPTTCELGDRNVVREFATLHRGTGEGGRTIIGSDNFLMACCHVAHDCVLGNRIIMANAASLAGHIDVEDYVIIGGLTPVHQFTRLGQHAMIGGGVRVGKDVPPYVLAGGETATFEGLNSIGLRRRGFSRETLEALDRAYELIYRAKLNVSQAVARIEADVALSAVPEVRTVLEFIHKSKRGIIPGPRLLSR